MAIYTGSNKQLGGTETVSKKEMFYYGLIQKNVLVTGANGQLGQEMKARAEITNTPFRFFFTDVDHLDITDKKQLEYFVERNSIEYIINCAAYTAVDKAEEDEETAYLINYEAVKSIAEVSSSHGVKIIHISTDYVFDGAASTPYKETDSCNPLSVYGKSKLKGEESIANIAHGWMIIRTSWLFSKYGANFVKTMLNLMSSREELNIVADQRGTPTYAADLAEMIFVILNEAEWYSGIYHFSNSGETTWYDFAGKIQKLAGLSSCKLNRITTAEYKTAAQRPMYSVFDKSKIENKYHVTIPTWENALNRMLAADR